MVYSYCLHYHGNLVFVPFGQVNDLPDCFLLSYFLDTGPRKRFFVLFGHLSRGLSSPSLGGRW